MSSPDHLLQESAFFRSGPREPFRPCSSTKRSHNRVRQSIFRWARRFTRSVQRKSRAHTRTPFIECICENIAPHRAFRQTRVQRRQIRRKIGHVVVILLAIKFQVPRSQSRRQSTLCRTNGCSKSYFATSDPLTPQNIAISIFLRALGPPPPPFFPPQIYEF